MPKINPLLVAVLAFAACSPAPTEEAPAAAATEGAIAAPAPGTPAPAAPADAPGADAAWDAEILAWAKEKQSADGFAGLIEPVSTFYGDFSGDGADDALAFAYMETGGSSAAAVIALFRNEENHMVFQRTVDDVYGTEPSNVKFSTGEITLTTVMPNPGDPHCCPTGSKDWTIAAK